MILIMKKIKYLISAVLLIITASCNEDSFLQEEPRDSLYPENLLVDYAGFKSMNTALYGMMRMEYQRADAKGGGIPLVMHSAWSCGVDNSWGNNTHTEVQFMYNPSLIKQTDKQLYRNIFTWCYQMINTANMVITRAEDSGVNWGSTQAEAESHKNEILAEARFVRAWAYRHLVFSFGAVPLTAEEINGLNYRTDWERNSVEEIRQLMKEDLTFARDNLPLRRDNNSQISGAMAIHYLAETLLAEGNPQQAANELQPLCEGNEYALMTERFGSNASNEGCPFIDVFRSPMYSDGNREVIFAFVNTEEESSSFGTAQVYMKSTHKNYYSNDNIIKKSNNKDPRLTSGEGTWAQVFWSNNGGKGAGRCVPSRGAFRLYNYKDQGTLDDRVSDYAIVWTIKERDADGNQVNYTNNGKEVVDTTVTSTMTDDNRTAIRKYNWPSTRKWDYVHPNLANGDKDGSYCDISYLRLADTYLLYAEALMKVGRYDEAVAFINKVRKRSHACDITVADLQQGGLDLILDERSRELLSEEERRHTLIRVSQENGGDERDVNNYFKRRMRRLNEIAGRDARGMNDYETPVLFPIPQSFINANTGRKLENNPGY